jgi:hypothetical protein
MHAGDRRRGDRDPDGDSDRRRSTAGMPPGHRNGRQIAFAHGRDAPSQRALEVIDPEGDNLRRLTTIPSRRRAGSRMPVWSPTADAIAFAVRDRRRRSLPEGRLDRRPGRAARGRRLERPGRTSSGATGRPGHAPTPRFGPRIPAGAPSYHVVVADATGARARSCPRSSEADAAAMVAGRHPGPRGGARNRAGGSDRLVSIDVRSRRRGRGDRTRCPTTSGAGSRAARLSRGPDSGSSLRASTAPSWPRIRAVAPQTWSPSIR